MQRICSKGTLSIHFSDIVTRINSRATRAMPNKAGKARKAVKRSILRNTRLSRSGSSLIWASTGCATCSIVPEMVVDAIVFHFEAWLKLPTSFIGNRLPKMKVRILLLTVLMIEVINILTLKGNIDFTGVKSMVSEGRQ